MKNSDLRLDDDIRTLLEKELDTHVPDPNSPEFQAFLEELQVERPDLFDEVMQGLQVNVTLPAEQQAQRAARRESVSRTFTRTFFQRSKVDGEAIPAKRRIMTYLFGAMAVFLPVMYILAQAFPGGAAPNTELQQNVALEPEPGLSPQPGVALVEPTQPEVVIPEPEPRVQLTGLSPSPKPPARKVSAVPLPPPPAPMPTAPMPTPSVTPQVAPAAPEPAQVLPDSTEVYKRQRAAPASTLVYEAERTKTNLQLYGSESSPPDTLSLPVSSSATPGAPQDTLLFDAAEQDATPNTPQNTVLFDAAEQAKNDPSAAGADHSNGAAGENTEGQRTGAQTSSAQTQTLPFTLPPGSRIQAVLSTGIFVAEGAAVPVVAQSQGAWCTETPCPDITWIGQAQLDVTNRVQVTFVQAIMEGASYPVSGLALNPDSSPGLGANLRDETSLSAENLLRNGVAGVSDYVDALVNQQRVTYEGNRVVSENTVPEVDTFIAGRIASLFDSPVAEGPTVRIADVPAGTPLLILYGVGTASPSAAQ